MRWITVAGPPSSGKTAVLTKVIPLLREKLGAVGIVKFDCTATNDHAQFASLGVVARSGLAGALCPDHFFAASIPDLIAFGREQGLEVLLTESAGLCSRCSPHIRGKLAVCIIDALSGIETPRKIGPMLRTADVVAITKGDLLSQAERDVFLYRVHEAGRSSDVLFVNGLTGQGAYELASILVDKSRASVDLQGERLRFPMPAALCSYCLGETRLGSDFQMGNVPKLTLGIPVTRGAAPPAPPRRPVPGEGVVQPPPAEASDLRASEPRAPALEAWDQEAPKASSDDFRPIESISILAGSGSSGQPEGFHSLTLVPGDVVAVVGPTGSGKSRLLADIEWLAQGDTPSRRRVLVDGQAPEPALRFSSRRRLVAQLSQTMTFVMDVSVAELVSLHATCLGDSRANGPIQGPEVVDLVLEAANRLTGEPIRSTTMLASLSGGQSRALMIADTAVLGRAPIVVIDEIENAGIDKRSAISLLLSQKKIVFLATHDPLLALSAQKRWAMKGGAIRATQERTAEEAALMVELEAIDRRIGALRGRLREGEPLLEATSLRDPPVRERPSERKCLP